MSLPRHLTCIYRKQNGNICNHRAKYKDIYCKRHKNKNNYIFEIMEIAIGHKNIAYEEDLYEIFKTLYDPIITQNINDSYQNQNSEENRKDIFLSIVKYCLSKHKLLKILHKVITLNGNHLNFNRKNIINMIYDIFKNTYEISQSDDNIHKIIKLQRLIRNHIYKKITQYNNQKSENEEDPFTFDSVNEIPITYKFSYKDSKGHVYIFNAVELEYFIRNQGAWNPYTKEEFPDDVLDKLFLFLTYNNHVPKSQEDFKWQTNIHALTDLSQIMEKMGFYNNVEWLKKLTYNICKNIISVYRGMSAEGFDNKYFPETFEMNEQTFIYDFCKEAINIFKDGDNHYLLCCNFVKALALNIEEFYNNIPPWLSNIETPFIFLNRNRGENNGMLFMYIQNLLDNINTFEEELRERRERLGDEDDIHWQISQIEFNFM